MRTASDNNNPIQSWRAYVIFAFGIIIALTGGGVPVQAQEAPAEDAAPEFDAAQDEEARYARCMALVEQDAAAASALIAAWTDGGAPATHCHAALLIQQGQPENAAMVLESLAQETTTTNPTLAGQLWAQAGEAWQLANRPQTAQQSFAAAIAVLPYQADFRVGRSIALADQGLYWEAIDDLNVAHETAPGRADILIYRASAYRLVNRLDLALEDIQAALQLTPLQPEALLERGNIHALTGNEEGALADWRRVIDLAPDTLAGKAAADNLTRVGEAP